MSIKDDFLKELKTTLTSAITPSLTTVSGVSDLFEAYALSLVLRAAQREGANISL